MSGPGLGDPGSRAEHFVSYAPGLYLSLSHLDILLYRQVLYHTGIYTVPARPE